MSNKKLLKKNQSFDLEDYIKKKTIKIRRIATRLSRRERDEAISEYKAVDNVINDRDYSKYSNLDY